MIIFIWRGVNESNWTLVVPATSTEDARRAALQLTIDEYSGSELVEKVTRVVFSEPGQYTVTGGPFFIP